MANKLKNGAASRACEKLYLNEDFADVHFAFKVDNEIQRVPANKIILAVLSPVFQAMFFGSLPEKGDVVIADADIDGFKEFLQFFYLGELTVTMENIETVIRLADKYDIQEYVMASAAFLTNHLTHDNICWGYQLAINLQVNELIAYCEYEITVSPEKVFATDGFRRCDHRTLMEILKLDLHCKEIDIFNACLEWAKSMCREYDVDDSQVVNLKNELGDCLKFIRFGLMNSAEFGECYVLYKELFTLEEFEDIMLTITAKKYGPKIFNKFPRHITYEWDHDNVFHCKRTSMASNIEKIVHFTYVSLFSTNHPLLLGKICTAFTFSMDTTVVFRSETKVKITEREGLTLDSSAPSKILYRGKSNIWGGRLNSHLQVAFPSPILILPGKFYEISLEHPEARDCLFISNWDPIINMEDGITINFPPNPDCWGYNSNASSWVSEFLFSKVL